MNPAAFTRQFEFNAPASVIQQYANSVLLVRSASDANALAFGDAQAFSQGASFLVVAPDASVAHPVTLSFSGLVNGIPVTAPVVLSAPGSLQVVARGLGRGWAVAGGASGGSGFSLSGITDLSVNDGHVDRVENGVVLRTSTQVLPAGAFNNALTQGNKSIAAVLGFEGMMLGSLTSMSFDWTSFAGETGPNWNPAGGPTTVTPYVNLLVDFDPLGGGDVRVLVIITDQLNPAINAAVGTYTNPGGLNRLTYSWDNTQGVLIVGAVPGWAPAPIVDLGPSWTEKAYSFADVLAARPDAVFVQRCPDDFANDGGLPAAALIPSVFINSSDSGTNKKSGKFLYTLNINGNTIF